MKENPAPSIGSRNSLIIAQRPKAAKPPIVQIIKPKIPIIYLFLNPSEIQLITKYNGTGSKNI